jgi:hypothetical protein
MNSNLENQQGDKRDLDFLENDQWLHNTEVRYYILERRGRWYVTMIFIAVENPLRFFCRFIDHYESARKAENYAEIFQRSIRKDARGTLKTNEDALNICYN